MFAQVLWSWNFERIIMSHDVSHVTCHISRVTCQVSKVRCQVSHFILFIYLFWQSCVASQWRVCYQGGLPRLVLKTTATPKGWHHDHGPTYDGAMFKMSNTLNFENWTLYGFYCMLHTFNMYCKYVLYTSQFVYHTVETFMFYNNKK